MDLPSRRFGRKRASRASTSYANKLWKIRNFEPVPSNRYPQRSCSELSFGAAPCSLETLKAIADYDNIGFPFVDINMVTVDIFPIEEPKDKHGIGFSPCNLESRREETDISEVSSSEIKSVICSQEQSCHPARIQGRLVEKLSTRGTGPHDPALRNGRLH